MVVSYLPRLHHFEIHEQSWCPPLLRVFLQDYLRWMWETFDMATPLVPLITKALRKTGATHVVDLCSGGGGPHRLLVPALREALAADGGQKKKAEAAKLDLTMTDLWPHVETWKELSAEVPGLRYVPESVDATNVPPSLKGFRTLFTSLHHFEPQLVAGILQDAVRKGEGIGVFEITNRDTLTVLLKSILAPLTAWCFPIFNRPFKFSYFLVGTVFPLGALLNLHDGVTSDFRTYSTDEMLAIVRTLEGHETYDWEVGYRRVTGPGRWWMPPISATAPYMIGTPKAGKKTN